MTCFHLTQIKAARHKPKRKCKAHKHFRDYVHAQKFLSLLLLVTILFNSLALSPAFADRTTDIVFNSKEEAAKSFNLDLEQLESTAVGQYMAANLPEILTQTAILEKELLEKEKEKRALYGDATFEKYVINGQFTEELRARIPDVGYAEYTPADNNTLIKKIVIQLNVPGIARSTQAVFFILPKNLDANSPHLVQLVSKNLIMAGPEQDGRDFVYLLTKKPEAEGNEFALNEFIAKAYAKPETYSKDWWRHYKKALWTTPTRANAKLAVFCASLQAGIACGIDMLTNKGEGLYGSLAAVHGWSLMVPLAFGTIIGTLSKTYKDWSIFGSREQRMAKSALISLSYAYIFDILRHGGAGYLFAGFTVATLLAHAHPVTNTQVNLSSKDSIGEFYRLQEDSGKYRDGWKKEGPLNRWPIAKQIHWVGRKGMQWITKGVKRSNWAYQMWQFSSFIPKQADLAGAQVDISGLDLSGVPIAEQIIPEKLKIGKAIYWTASLWAPMLWIGQARRLAAEGKITQERLEKLEKAWKDAKRLKFLWEMPINFAKAGIFVVKASAKTVIFIGRMIVKTCALAITSDKPREN